MYTPTILLITLTSLAAHVSGNAIRFYNSPGCGTVFSGCENIGPNVCCTTADVKYAVSISKTAIDFGIGWTASGSNLCGTNVCSAGGAGTICCTAGIPNYRGGSFYTITKKSRVMARDGEEEQKCTSSQEADVFGLSLGDGKHLQIGTAQSNARGKAHADLKAAFEKVAEEDAHAWLVENGAVEVVDEPITETITSSSL